MLAPVAASLLGSHGESIHPYLLWRLPDFAMHLLSLVLAPMLELEQPAGSIPRFDSSELRCFDLYPLKKLFELRLVARCSRLC